MCVGLSLTRYLHEKRNPGIAALHRGAADVGHEVRRGKVGIASSVVPALRVERLLPRAMEIAHLTPQSISARWEAGEKVLEGRHNLMFRNMTISPKLLI